MAAISSDDGLTGTSTAAAATNLEGRGGCRTELRWAPNSLLARNGRSKRRRLKMFTQVLDDFCRSL